MNIADLLSATGLPGGDMRPLWVALIALAAGVSRGFTGFGAGMIFIPSVSALYSPPLAIALLFIIDFLGTTPLLLPHFRACNWREVLPLSAAAALAFPFGLYFLTRLDPLLVRWALSLFIAAVVVVMASGWRYRRQPGRALSAGIGTAAGFVSGAIGLGGPLIVLFWLGGQDHAARVRSNIFAFFGLFSIVSGIGYFAEGMLTREVLLGALALLPFYLGPIIIGQRIFHRSSDRVYRQVALGFCGFIALATMPLWQRLFG